MGRLGGLGHPGCRAWHRFYSKGSKEPQYGLNREVCDCVYDLKKSLCGFRGKQGLLGIGVDVGAASGGDGRAGTRVGPGVQGSGCILHMFSR